MARIYLQVDDITHQDVSPAPIPAIGQVVDMGNGIDRRVTEFRWKMKGNELEIDIQTQPTNREWWCSMKDGEK